ncbi:MAG: alpha-glucan family phosphorylase [Myxococcales bacterium]|nr:alpha-glucan family phosphorylase [Myxococcales bacterium]
MTAHTTAYISAEFGLRASLPTYSGGLGVLAGDHVKAAADAGLPLVGISLYYHQGYGLQRIDAHGDQQLDFPRCPPSSILKDSGIRLTLRLSGIDVRAHAWRFDQVGRGGHVVPVYFLDTLLPENPPEWRDVSRMLYGGDHSNRLRQEAVMGIGGYALMKAIGYKGELRAHLNEGHTAFFACAMLRELKDREVVRQRVHFTTHTPVPAGHDVFDLSEVLHVVGEHVPESVAKLGGKQRISMSELASQLAATCNGVSEINARVARDIFPNRQVDGLTNGVHFDTWVNPAMGHLFDAHIPGWRDDARLLESLPERTDPAFLSAFDAARAAAKRDLIEYANGVTQLGMSEDVLTLGFARRTAPYKRATLLFADLDRLLKFGSGRVQVIFAGKAHPNDVNGRALVSEIVRRSRELRGQLSVAFLPNYNMWLGRMLTSGVDIWLNNPIRPLEACGTSGMKAALNGVPNFSVLDGWWAEACAHGDNGWAIGHGEEDRDDLRDADALYRVLGEQILPAWESNPEVFRAVRMRAIATAPRFSAARMVHAYDERYYRRTDG